MGLFKPDAPDPNAAIQAQSEANRVNVMSPYGSQVYGTTTVDENGNPVFTAGSNQATIRLDETPYQQQQRLRGEAIGTDVGNVVANRAAGMGSILGGAYQNENAFTPQAISSINPNPAMTTTVGSGPMLQTGINAYTAPEYLRATNDRAGEFQRQISTAGLTPLTNTGSFQGDAALARNAVFEMGRSQMDPVFSQERERITNELTQRGIPVGSEAWNREMNRMDRSQSQELRNLANQSILTGGQEQSRLFGISSAARGQEFGERTTQGQFANQATQLASGEEQRAADQYNALMSELQRRDLAAASFGNQALQQGFANQITGATFGNQARAQDVNEQLARANLQNQQRSQSIQEQLLQRNQNINELAQMLGLSPSQPLPQIMTNPGQIDTITPTYAGYNAAVQQSQGAMSGLAGLGQAAIMGSFLCWVAREVYGASNPKWLDFRDWLTTKAPKWLLRMYTKHGQKFAAWIADKPRIKSVIRRMMDSVIGG